MLQRLSATRVTRSESHSLVVGASAALTRAFLTGCVGLLFTTGLARAACDPTPPSDGDSVVCTGDDETGYDARGATDLTLTTSGVTNLDDSSALDAAIALSASNDVTIGADATIRVTEPGGAGIRGGDDNFVTNEGLIRVEAANGVAIDVGSVIADDQGDTDPSNDVDPVPVPTITNSGVIQLEAPGSIGLRVVDNYDVTNASTGSIVLDATAAGGIAIEGRNDNILRQNGTITIEASDAWGVRFGENTGLPLPNGAVFGNTSQTTVNGDDSVALEVGDNAGTAVSGTIDLNGDRTVGVRVGNRTDDLIPANHTQSGTINVNGADAIGMQMGDGWISYQDDGETLVPSAPGIRNQNTINVVGERAIGLFAGDASNLAGDHDSFVSHSGTIEVTGTDAIGVSVGGNGLLDRWDFDDPNANQVIFTLDTTGGTITGGPDAGPLVVFRDFVAGKENRLLHRGTLRADLTNSGTADRGIAVLGTNGDELIFNLGTVSGDVRLGGGNDRYVVNADSVFEQGVLDGGDGLEDEVHLKFTTTEDGVGIFDAAPLTGFERILVEGRNLDDGETVGWTIRNGAGFTNEVFVIAEGRLVAPGNPDGTTDGVVLGGSLRVDPAGSVLVAPDGTTTPIQVTGSASLDGALIVEPTQRLDNAGTYRLIDAAGGIGDTRFASETLPDAWGIFSLSTAYDATGLDLIVTGSTFAAVANTSNRSAIGGYLDALYADGGTPSSIGDVIDDLRVGPSNLNPAYDALSPEPYDAQTTVISESSRRIAHLLFDRPRECESGERDPWQGSSTPLTCHARALTAWATAIGSIRERDAHSGHPEYEAEIGGLVLGVDLAPIGDLDLSFALTGQRGQIDVQGHGKSDLVLADLTGHASWQRGALRIQAATGYGFGAHGDRRNFRIDEVTPTVAAGTSDDHSSHHVSAAAQAGYLFDWGPVGIEPIAGLDYLWITQDEIRESGGGPWGLVVDDRDDSVLSVTAGLRLGTVYHHTAYVMDSLLWMDGIWRPTLDIGWRQILVGAERDLKARLNGAPDTVQAFEIEGDEDAGGFELGAGLSFVPKNANRLQFDLRYDLFRGPETLEHDLVAKVRIGF
jgi:uncharacterized protein with beta-barrel porin domain